MAEARLCPLKAGAVQAQFAYLSADRFLHSVERSNAYISGEALAQAQEEFGQCDREKCALWASEQERCPENPAADKQWGKCGLIAARPYIAGNQHYHP